VFQVTFFAPDHFSLDHVHRNRQIPQLIEIDRNDDGLICFVQKSPNSPDPDFHFYDDRLVTGEPTTTVKKAGI